MKQSTSSIAEIKGKAVPIKNNDSTLILMKFEDERTISRVSKYLENQNQLKRNNFNLF
jgi:hypothetical protein